MGSSQERGIQLQGEQLDMDGMSQDATAQSPKINLVTKNPSQKHPKVAILLCTYHGQHYLSEQLDSFAAQTYKNWEVWVSDDHSLDDTQKILVSYVDQWGEERFSIHYGPKNGFVANFLSLTCKADIEADYYAYSDQDDIWEPDKLQRAVDWLTTIPKDIPALYCSRTNLVDENNNHIGYSPLFSKKPCFANALVQSIGGGNTMVFNAATKRLLCEAGDRVDAVSHDWWLYMVVSGCGGEVFYDPHPRLRYRQHGGNVAGHNTGLVPSVTRIRKLWRGRFREWNDRNIHALQSVHDHLTPENRDILDRFVELRNRGGLISRLICLKRSGIHRQTFLGNLGLVAAAVLKKL